MGLLGRGLRALVIDLPSAVLSWPALQQALESLGGEGSEPFQVSPDDEVAVGMVRQPVPTAEHQLVDLGAIDPVVLVVVESRDQDVEVLKKARKSLLALDFDGQVLALAPRWKALVELMRACNDLVANGLEKAA